MQLYKDHRVSGMQIYVWEQPQDEYLSTFQFANEHYFKDLCHALDLKSDQTLFKVF